MKSEIFYEWVVEHVDEHGDIQDIDHHDDFISAWMEPMKKFGKQIALKRDVGNDEDGLILRGYAYVKEGKYIETDFSCGHKVPMRFQKEVKNSLDR